MPTLIQEQNSYPGITNKILAKKANKICVAYDNLEAFFPKDKIVKTGNPVRNNMVEIEGKRAKAFAHFSLDPNKKTILVIGGSLGARTLNQSIQKDLNKIIDQDVQIIWQTGKFYFKQIQSDLAEGLKSPLVACSEFIFEMDLAYAAADIIISRAGAISVSELCLIGKPTILVPSPNVAEDHQTKNAMALVNIDAAVLVKDSEAQNELIPQALAILKDTERQVELSKNIKTLGIPDAAQRILKEIEKLVG